MKCWTRRRRRGPAHCRRGDYHGARPPRAGRGNPWSAKGAQGDARRAAGLSERGCVMSATIVDFRRPPRTSIDEVKSFAPLLLEIGVLAMGDKLDEAIDLAEGIVRRLKYARA